ncbi:Chitinase 1 [Beauveria bassiana]|uniref:chitinase n=1 Tax=Beauveria bassiana TaxID=176275 RepID=A0A2N6N925_BEABA|nr:Chitinase 1 [Beauveria bassiana]
MKTSPLALLAGATIAAAAGPRTIMYFDQYHTTTTPPKDVTAGVNYVITAFAPSTTFNTGTDYTPFMPLDQVRALFQNGTKVCMAVGGWADTEGFGVAAASEESRKLFAENVAKTADKLGYDCVDIDWEYPGGNGEDYKENTNDGKVSEIETYPLLLQEIKTAIGDKELSIAVPGKEGDMIAYTKEKVPEIIKAVDFVNVMTYDLMNRRNNVTNHHTSIEGSLASIDAYIARGVPAEKMNLGFAFYARFFNTKPGVTCDKPTGCVTDELELSNGTDTGRSGAVTFEKENIKDDFLKAIENGQADKEKGGQWYWDATKEVYWTWDTPEFISEKRTKIVEARKLGGVFAWSLCQDSFDWSRIKALTAGTAQKPETAQTAEKPETAQTSPKACAAKPEAAEKLETAQTAEKPETSQTAEKPETAQTPPKACAAKK